MFFQSMGLDPAEGYFPSVVLIAAIVVAVLIVAAYAMCYLFSGKHRVGWLIAALVFFAFDTLGLLFYYGIALDSLMDILFHIWVLYYLIAGVTAHYKLKRMPADEPFPVAPAASPEAAAAEGESTATGTIWDAINDEMSAAQQSAEAAEQPAEPSEQTTEASDDAADHQS